jgi:hypothetical protein
MVFVSVLSAAAICSPRWLYQGTSTFAQLGDGLPRMTPTPPDSYESTLLGKRARHHLRGESVDLVRELSW